VEIYLQASNMKIVQTNKRSIMSLTNFYVYQYIRKDSSPFYISKGSKNRINESHSPWLAISAPQLRQIIKDNLLETESKGFKPGRIPWRNNYELA